MSFRVASLLLAQRTCQMLETLSLGSYVLLVDYTSRLFRKGKANLNAGVKEVFERLETSAECWNDRIKKMLSCRELRGTFCASDAQRLRDQSANSGKRRANLCPRSRETFFSVSSTVLSHV